MILNNNFLLLTIETLTGKYNISHEKSLLESSIELSRLRNFHKIKKQTNCKNFDSYRYLKFIFQINKVYFLFVYEITYILNLRKKFTSDNNNRMVSNYFHIIFSSFEKPPYAFIFSQEIIRDREYLTTFALNNLYIIGQLKNETQNT